MTSECPKPWSEIKPESDGPFDMSGSWLEIGGVVRVYDDTMYVRADAGMESDTEADEWYPFDAYVQSVVSRE